MKKSLAEHAARFDEVAAEYDEDQSPEYRACVSLVVEHADPGPGDVVLDLGCGTGAIALALAGGSGSAPESTSDDQSDSQAPERVLGRDISEGMMEQAREKAAARGLDNVEFGEGSFRDPAVTEPVDIVTSNFAMHHLSDEEKREAIQVVADLGARRFVLGDVMFFGKPDPEEPFYSPDVDDPATVGLLADALTDAGFVLTAVELVHDQVGVLVAERAG